MTFVPVDKLPESNPPLPYKRRADILNEFLEMSIKYARMDFNTLEYSCATQARSAMAQTVKRYSMPIKVKLINNELYLINLELEEEPKNENT